MNVTLSKLPRRKPQPPLPSIWGSPPTLSRSTPPRHAVARTPPARPPPPARRPTITGLGQPLVVSKPAPGGALAAARAAMGPLLPVEQYCRYWELDSSSTPSPPQPSMMVLIRNHIQRQSANLPENQRSHHRFQTDRLRLCCSAVPLSIPLLTFGEATLSVSSYPSYFAVLRVLQQPPIVFCCIRYSPI